MPATVPIPHPLPEPLVELIAQRFRVLGEPMRIKLLDRLRDGDATVGELQEALGASQQNVSKHLGVLLQAGIVSRTKQRHLVASTRSPTRASSSCASRSAAACAASSPSSTRSSQGGQPHDAPPVRAPPTPAGRSSACCSPWPAR